MSLQVADSLGTWSEFARAVADLQDESMHANPGPAAQPVAPFGPAVAPPPARIVAAAREVGSTPAVLWDVPGLDAQVEAVRNAAARHGIGLNCALKPCHTPAVLDRLRVAGLGADAATRGEHALARRIGFGAVSASGPSLRDVDLRELLLDGVQLDVQSPTQLGQLETGLDGAVRGADERGTGWGVRLRVPVPDALRSSTSRGEETRFGILFDERTAHRLGHGQVPVQRIRVHTGEATAALLGLRARFALTAARFLGSVTEVNLGGGLLRLARDPAALDAALGAVARAAAEMGAAAPRLWIEPGAALVLDSAYLVTSVIDADVVAGERRGVTVDASAWNLAPWARPSVWTVRDDVDRYSGEVFGPSLYEGDQFRRHPEDGTTQAGPRLRTGERLLVNAFGAYTLVHARTFGAIPLPQQYLVDDKGVEQTDD